MLRDRFAGPHTVDTAINKAYTAVTFKLDTTSFTRSTQGGEPASGVRHLPRIVAIGGGSVMDAAKAIGLSAANNKHPSKLVGYFKGRHGPAPIYAVPTTAGTGSEVTVAAVVSDPTVHLKRVIADTRLVPRMAALDPCLMTGLPPAVTAATGMDALTHAIECYCSKKGNPFSDLYGLEAIRLIARSIRHAHRDGGDVAARSDMLLGAFYGGACIATSSTTAVHALAYPLGGKYPSGASAGYAASVHAMCANASAGHTSTSTDSKALCSIGCVPGAGA